MEQLDILKKVSNQHGGIIDNKSAEKYGISRATLAKLCADGFLYRIVRGQYIFPDELQDELLSLDKRSPHLVFSHETALFLHGLSDRTPFQHTMTISSKKVPSKAILDDCKIYYIKDDLFDLGETVLTTPMGNQVSGYDLERTICDMLRSRNSVGTETFLAAMKLYAQSPKKDLNRLYEYAKKMRLTSVVQNYLEVLL